MSNFKLSPLVDGVIKDGHGNSNLYRVIKITNDIENYPEYKEDTEKYPHLVEYVGEDDFRFFVLDEGSRVLWDANDFFFMTDVNVFKVLE